MRFVRFGIAIGLLSCGVAVVAADEPQATSVFNGKTLAGWKTIGCEATVRDGALLLKSGNGLVYLDRPYRDFIFDFEWKALQQDKYDSGIYLRCELPAAGSKRPWPKRYQVNLLKGQEGNLLGVDGGTSTGLVNRGQWNRFRLVVKGAEAALEINGQPAWKTTGLETEAGYIGFQSEVPLGGQFLFRKIQLTNLTDAE